MTHILVKILVISFGSAAFFPRPQVTIFPGIFLLTGQAGRHNTLVLSPWCFGRLGVKTRCGIKAWPLLTPAHCVPGGDTWSGAHTLNWLASDNNAGSTHSIVLLRKEKSIYRAQIYYSPKCMDQLIHVVYSRPSVRFQTNTEIMIPPGVGCTKGVKNPPIFSFLV